MSSGHHDDHVMAPPHVVEVGEDVYAYIQPDGSWWINNTGFIVGSRAVTAIDTCSTERRTRAYLDAVAAVSPQPVRTLVNTHHHGDHTHGNWLVDGATIVAHDRTREEMAAAPHPSHLPFWEAAEWGDWRLAPPTLTFSDGVTLWVDDLRCEVSHVGTPAHTTNDSVVWVPGRSVLFAGDLVFNGGTPFVLMGSVSGALTALGSLRRFGADTIVPGHGEPCDGAAIDTCADYLRWLTDLAAAGHAAGRTPLETAQEADLGAWAELLDAERVVGNLHRAFAEIGGAAPGAPIDLAGALTDMVAFNGGRPLRCWA